MGYSKGRTPLPTFTRQQLEALAKDGLISLLLAMGQPLAQRAARLQALAAQWAQNRRTPPSSDGLKQKPKSRREQGKRLAGSTDQGLSYRRWTSKSVSIRRKSRVVAGVRRRGKPAFPQR